MKKYLFGLLIALAAVGCTSKPVLNITGTPIVGKKSLKEIDETIQRTLRVSNWRVDDVKPGKITASIQNRSHMAKILISFTEKAYDIEYLDSSNLDYDSSGKTIHRNYNRWVAKLNKQLQNAL